MQYLAATMTIEMCKNCGKEFEYVMGCCRACGSERRKQKENKFEYSQIAA